MIFQDPMMTLTPVLKIETQMVETILAHERVTRKAARARAVDVLGRVGIPAPETRIGAYTHQFSGGMRQRVAIAIALLQDPAPILADEPTTALDVTIQGQIIAEIQKLVAETGAAMIWVSHDLAVVETIAETISVMYAGRIVESGPAADVIGRPAHPYTEGLLNSIPSRTTPGQRLNQIPGMAPSVLNLPPGCGHHEGVPAKARSRRAHSDLAGPAQPARSPGRRRCLARHRARRSGRPRRGIRLRQVHARPDRGRRARQFSRTGNNQMTALHIFDRLILTDENVRPIPGLAVEWTNEDETTWLVKLREGVTFHDGTPLTAEDVVYSLERAPNVPNSPASFANSVSNIAGMEIVDDHTIRFTTATPDRRCAGGGFWNAYQGGCAGAEPSN